MLNWIAEKFTRTDDTLGSEAGIRAFLEPLQAADATVALTEIGNRFAGVAELELDASACRHALKRLDEAAQQPIEQIRGRLFSDSLGSSIADGPWNALVNYYRNLFCGYSFCLEQLPPAGKLDDAELQDALLFAARAMAALRMHTTLMRIRYRDPHPAFFTDAHTLLTRAERYGIAHSPAKLYTASTQQTTVEREFVGAFLLNVAPTGTLLPTQTYCLHLILQRFGEHYRLSDTYSNKMPFFIDPAKGKLPQRWLVGLKPRPGVRFFGLGDAHAMLDMLCNAAQTGDSAPEWVQQSSIDVDRYRALLETLAEHWSENPPQRRSRRDRQVAAILVTHGLNQVHRMIAYSRFSREGRQISYAENSATDPTIFKARFGSVGDENPQQDAPRRVAAPMEVLEQFELKGDRECTERWAVVDTSEGGLGAIAERHTGWLRAGMMIGFRYHDSIDWRVATVRRLGRTPQGKLGVGLQCEGETVTCARLRLHQENAADVWIASGIGGEPHADAILVGGEQPMLMVAPGTYAPERECALTVEKRSQNIRFDKLLERGVDFECISFSPVAAA